MAEYLGMENCPFKCGDHVNGILSYSFDIGIIKLVISLPATPLEFIYPTWEVFESAWKVIERNGILA
jgi:hypothetical protein